MMDTFVQWGFDLIKNSYLNREKEIDPKDETYLHYLSPFSKEFYGANTPVILFGGHDFREVEKRGHITIRDGLLPLSLFFQQVKPDEVQCQLYIHCDMWFIVPDEWRKKVKFYKVKADNEFSNNKKPEKLFITGILNSTMADPDQFEAMLKKIADEFKGDISKMDVIAFFPEKRNDLWGTWEEHNILKFSKLIFKHLGLNITTPSWGDIYNTIDYKDYLYYEINEGLFIKDSYIQHRVLSRGGGLLHENNESKLFKRTGEVRASLYHRYELFELNEAEAGKYVSPVSMEKLPFFKRIADHEFNEVKFNFEWEKWYASYFKKMIKERNSLK